MALGTIASRVTGFGRTAVLTFALGTGILGDAYNTANVIPFIVYDLLLGGILQSIVVPILVRRRKADRDGGVGYEQRLFTLVTLALLVITLAAIAVAGPLLAIYVHDPVKHELTTIFARYLLAQIFFIGISGLFSAMLNTRGRFAAPMWSPVLNNLVILAVGVAFLAVTGGDATAESVTPGEIVLLGVGTVGGMMAQVLALLVAVHRAGFRWRPRFDFRSMNLAEIGKLATWSVVYLFVFQAGYAVTANLANRAGSDAVAEGLGYGAGFTPYNNAYQLFQLPYAIIAVSVITALLPRMSEHASDGRNDLLRGDFGQGLRLSSALIVPASLLMAALAPSITVLLFSYFNTSTADAAYIGEVLAVFALGLVPFTVFQLLLRVFYAMHDTRTPALVAFANVAVNAGVGVLAYTLLPAGHAVTGLAAGFGLQYVVGSVIAWLVMSRRTGGLGGRAITSTIARLYLASVPGLIFAFAMSLAFTTLFGTGRLQALLSLAVGGGIGMLLFVIFARALRVTEVTSLLDTVRAKLPGRRGGTR
ncbi:MAG: murein biosynthesis integral membrane protein MurJ [Streptosporangiales bacterium]|nr:murein biosynthesis integral membrane protein MurJ [Streptosporangiales bacterium]